MFSSTRFLVVFSVIATCSAKPIKFLGYKCAYSSDPSVVGGDLSKCHSCSGYSNVALLQTDNWFQPIFLFCYQTSNSINPQVARTYNPGTIH